MGKSTVQWSPIQLRITNQHKIIPMGILLGIIVDIKGASVLANFEVIEIVDDNNPYPALLGIDWAIDMNGVINLNKKMMSFEMKLLCVVVPLEPAKAPCYIDSIHDYETNDGLD